MIKELICIVCPRGCHLEIDVDNGYKVSGNSCPRGIEYGVKELTSPTRVVTSTVKIKGGIHNRLPVKTNGAIPKELNFECMKLLDDVEVSSPVKVGDVIIENVLGTGIDLIATRNM
ncbi:MAG: DUF1667 domain-containing protein [Clostridium argentinense]|uniref:DUF1667 domain-containing protein n=1 Tax=Clostridium faecium TaxID=2762223 RepID=A0ABR8YVS6_9CLOT|nr:MULTISPECIES: DUF1667 domain-containing protein [Clostridium]MBD8048359.1 DUF1667 domain-containing protein [Clostridium faecium]MBS5822309.1 DUF1667 domain-containing protein [Clostridium argentinense]MDU1348515.1 DUF1667 domain-containing protein [Clostridium argentinense]